MWAKAAGWVLKILPQEMCVCRLDPGEPIPAWALQADFFCLSRTHGELSLLCPAGLVPAGVERLAGWRALMVQGPLDFAEVGVLAGLSGALALAGVSLLAFSTYGTDYLLVRQENLAQAQRALVGIGCQVSPLETPPAP